MQPTRPIITILGPTASGKTALSIRLARRFGGVVISADSRQVYRGLDLSFATVTKPEMEGVRHYLLRYVSLNEQYSAGQYALAFQRVLKKIPRETPIFFVGGSPFYIEAALHPEKLANVKSNPVLRKRLEKRPLSFLISHLASLDPVRAKSIDQHNRRRLVRAIEIALTPHARHPAPSALRPLKIGVSQDRKKLYQRIDARVDRRFASDMLAEVKRAHQRGISWQRLESLGLEPRYMSRIVRGQLSEAQGVEQLKGAIHGFVRRQLTWWRRDRSIRWIQTTAQAERLVRKFLRNS